MPWGRPGGIAAFVSIFEWQKNKIKIYSRWSLDRFIKQRAWINLFDALEKNAVIEVGGWNPDFHSHQEYELAFRLMKAGKQIIPLNQADTIVRERNSGSITKNTQPNRAIEGIKLREAMWQYVRENNLDNFDRYDAFRQYLFQNLRGYSRSMQKRPW